MSIPTSPPPSLSALVQPHPLVVFQGIETFSGGIAREADTSVITSGESGSRSAMSLPQAQTAISLSTSNYVNIDQLSAAEDTSRRATDKGEKVLGREHLDILESVHDPADTLLRMRSGGRDLSTSTQRERKWSRRGTTDNLDSILSLASFLLGRGKYKAAEEMLRRAVEVSEKVLENEHPKTRAIIRGLTLCRELN
jgi:hypothetical protein